MEKEERLVAGHKPMLRDLRVLASDAFCHFLENSNMPASSQAVWLPGFESNPYGDAQT